jgi:hypothetical protein
MLKKILLLAVVVIAALAFAGVKSAQADKAFSPACDKNSAGHFTNAVNFAYDAADNEFHGIWQQNCGNSPESVEVEIQRLTNGAWFDIYNSSGNTADKTYPTSGSQANITVLRTAVFGNIPNCVHGQYKFKVYDNDSSDSSASFDPC